MKSIKITGVINEIWDGVEQSKAGKITDIKDGNLVINHVGFNTFLNIINSLFPKSVSGDVKIKEPKEPWQG